MLHFSRNPIKHLRKTDGNSLNDGYSCVHRITQFTDINECTNVNGIFGE